MFARFRVPLLVIAIIAVTAVVTTLVNQLAFDTTDARSRSSTHRDGVEARISARQIASGKVELALQRMEELALQRMEDGDWGHRVLPRSRFFSPKWENGHWRNSSRIWLCRSSDPRYGDDWHDDDSYDD